MLWFFLHWYTALLSCFFYEKLDTHFQLIFSYKRLSHFHDAGFIELGNVFGVVLELVMLWSEMAIISKQSNPPFVAWPTPTNLPPPECPPSSSFVSPLYLSFSLSLLLCAKKPLSASSEALCVLTRHRWGKGEGKNAENTGWTAE